MKYLCMLFAIVSVFSLEASSNKESTQFLRKLKRAAERCINSPGSDVCTSVVERLEASGGSGSFTTDAVRRIKELNSSSTEEDREAATLAVAAVGVRRQMCSPLSHLSPKGAYQECTAWEEFVEGGLGLGAQDKVNK